MEEIVLINHVVKVDREKNINLYKALPKVSEKSHCGCEDCQNYANHIVQASSEVLAFFKQFGVDPTKEAEVWKAASNLNGYDIYTADYYFVGEIQDTNELDWIQIAEASFGLTNYTGEIENPMIPSTFDKPLIELAVRIKIPHTELQI